LKELKVANKKLKEVDKQKTDFISIASHQLRTPLTAIKGYTSMILEGTFGKMSLDIKGVVDKVFQSSQRLIYIVNDMLDVSRIEEGRLRYEYEDVKVANLIKEVFEELSINTKTKNLDFTFSVEPEDAEILVNADYGKLRQSLTNVIDNAIKYTESGFVKLSLGKTEDGKNIVFEVKDSGIGMAKDQLSSVFEKFERSKDAIKTHTEGSGLGLYVAKEMIKTMGGVVWAASEGLKKGSQFYIKFPIKSAK